MKHAKLLIILCVLSVIVYGVLCFNAVFSVSDINVDYSVYSNKDVEKAQEILNSYKRKNMFFVDEEEISSRIVAETSLKVKNIEKKYPGTLKVSLFARQERFALSLDGGYYILDDEYTVVDFRSAPSSSADLLDNVILLFEIDEKVVAEDKKALSIENGEQIMETVKKAAACFESPRDVLESLRFYETEEKGNYRLEINLRCGVRFEILKATSSSITEKTEAGIQKFNALSQGDKLEGTISCYETVNGKIVAAYDKD